MWASYPPVSTYQSSILQLGDQTSQLASSYWVSRCNSESESPRSPARCCELQISPSSSHHHIRASQSTDKIRDTRPVLFTISQQTLLSFLLFIFAEHPALPPATIILVWAWARATCPHTTHICPSDCNKYWRSRWGEVRWGQIKTILDTATQTAHPPHSLNDNLQERDFSVFIKLWKNPKNSFQIY